MHADVLTTAREAYGRRAWTQAHELLGRADEAAPLAPETWSGSRWRPTCSASTTSSSAALARAHHARLRDGDRPGAVRAAFWIGVHLIIRGETGRASGWLGRAHRLLEQSRRLRGARLPLRSADALRQHGRRRLRATRDAARTRSALGERFGDPDLVALGLIDLGRALIERGSVAEGLGLLDEAMVAAAAGELRPSPPGFVYCGVIEGCQRRLRAGARAEWTVALTDWCAQPAGPRAVHRPCLVHRAEILQVARRVGRGPGRGPTGRLSASTQRGPAGRGRGLYRCGRDPSAARRPRPRPNARSGTPAGTAGSPQPGLALLRSRRDGSMPRCRARIAAGHDAADRLGRARRLRPPTSRSCSPPGELGRGAGRLPTSSTRSPGAPGGRCCSPPPRRRRGAVALAGGDAARRRAAAPPCVRLWLELEAPYEAARARLRVAEACRTMGDDETRRAGAARRRGTSSRGWAPAIDLRAPSRPAVRRRRRPHGLTPRELEVLRRLATGESNKAIAAAAGREPADGGPAREQPLRQAARLVARRGDGVRLRARCSSERPSGSNDPRARSAEDGLFDRSARPSPGHAPRNGRCRLEKGRRP